MIEPPIFLVYRWHGWIIEFKYDHFEMVNPANGDRYSIALDPYADLPFQIQLLERGKPEWRQP